jgi:cytidyltransferase-like protein
MIIETKAKLKKIIDSAKSNNKSVLIKKGVFDIIHPGHIFATDCFRKQADIVIILVQSDELTRKNKGNKRPINTQKQRAEVIDKIKGVDYTYRDNSGSRKEYLSLLKYLKPTIVAITSKDSKKTKDYRDKSWKLKRFPDKKNPSYSTTLVIKKILKRYLY